MLKPRERDEEGYQRRVDAISEQYNTLKAELLSVLPNTDYIRSDGISNFLGRFLFQCTTSPTERNLEVYQEFIDEVASRLDAAKKSTPEQKSAFQESILGFSIIRNDAPGFTPDYCAQVCREHWGEENRATLMTIERGNEVVDVTESLKRAPVKWQRLLRTLEPAEQKHLMEVVEFTEREVSIKVKINDEGYLLHLGNEDYGVDLEDRGSLLGKDGIVWNDDTPMFTQDGILKNIEKKNHLTGNKVKAICQALCPYEEFAPGVELTSLYYLVTLLGCQEKGTMRGDEVYGAAGRYDNKSAAQIAELNGFSIDEDNLLGINAAELPVTASQQNTAAPGERDLVGGAQGPTIALMTTALGTRKAHKGGALDTPMLIQVRGTTGKISAVGNNRKGEPIQAPTRYVRNKKL